MIKDVRIGNILSCSQKHIAFAINTEGLNKSKIAKQVMEIGFHEINDRTFYPMESIITKKIDHKTYYGLVCYSTRTGFYNQTQIIKNCLNKIQTEEDIAIVEIGDDNFEKSLGANKIELKMGMQHSNKNLVLYRKV